MPGEPVESTRHSETLAGPISLRTFTVKLPEGRAAYMVAYNDYPKAMLYSAKSDEILERVVHGAVGGDHKVQLKKPITLDKHPGRSLKGSVKNGLEYDGRFYLVGTRLYQISIINEPTAVQGEDRTRFFKSFELIEP